MFLFVYLQEYRCFISLLIYEFEFCTPIIAVHRFSRVHRFSKVSFYLNLVSLLCFGSSSGHQALSCPLVSLWVVSCWVYICSHDSHCCQQCWCVLLSFLFVKTGPVPDMLINCRTSHAVKPLPPPPPPPPWRVQIASYIFAS